MRDKSIAVLAFTLFCLTTATLFLRPAELFEWLDSWPIYETLILSTLLLACQSMQGHFVPYYLARQPITLSVVGILVAVALSHAQHFDLGIALDSTIQFIKTLIYYGLLITVVNSPARLRCFALIVAICASTMVTLCVLDFFEIYDFDFIVHLDDWDGLTDEDEIILTQRMRGTGIFQDPNDLSSAIVLAMVLCLYFLTDKSLSKFRYCWLIPESILFVGLLCTKSRGGLLAFIVSALTYTAIRYGGKTAIVASVLGGCLIAAIGGRQTEVDLEDGTGQERVQLWQEGFEALKSTDFFFGIGHSNYADVAGLVAHNSYIHAYVELGVIGGTMFFGCFFFAAMQLFRLMWLKEDVKHPELVRMLPFVIALLAGWGTSLYSLSRCYVIPTYLVFGICAAYLNLIWIHTRSGEPLVICKRSHAVWLYSSSACAFVSLYLVTRLLSR